MRVLGMILAATIAMLFVGLSTAHAGGHVALSHVLADAYQYGPLTLLFGMAIPNFGPTTGYARFATVMFPTMGVTPQVVTTATTPVALTTAQILQGLLPVDCQDAGSITTPTAAAIVAAINGCQVGTSFDLDVINYGDTTLTMALGTGVTKTTIATVAAVLTMVTLVSKRFRFIVTNVTPGSEAVTIWAFGSTAAAVA